jgi:hypothetical protein
MPFKQLREVKKPRMIGGDAASRDPARWYTDQATGQEEVVWRATESTTSTSTTQTTTA